jgi:hypothetical protein
MTCSLNLYPLFPRVCTYPYMGTYRYGVFP